MCAARITLSTERPIRLVADDLTGALDSAAQFASADRPLAVQWRSSTANVGAALVVDTGNRERSSDEARAAFEHYLPILAPRSDALSFLKLDSLLRGHAGLEIAACARAWPSRTIIVAPAMPFQGRITRGGRQMLIGAGEASPIGEDIASTLRAAGLDATVREPGEPLGSGINVCDVESDADLAKLVSNGMPLESNPLWCGSAGLAGAIAALAKRNFSPSAPPCLAKPILGVFGSHHPVTQRQLAESAEHVFAIGDAKAKTSRSIMTRFHAAHVVLLSFRLPADIDHNGAARQIDAITRSLLVRFARPVTLLASGGATLRSACDALDVDHLVVDGQIEPGVPCSRMMGGMWDGVRVVSKSGAFGAPDLLCRIIEQATPFNKV